MSNEDLSHQVNQRLDLLATAVGKGDVASIARHAQGTAGVRNIIGGSFNLTDLQRRRMRAEAQEIEKLMETLNESERNHLLGIPEMLRDASNYKLNQ